MAGQTDARIVIIGAGIGGLAAAVLLAAAGLPVTVVEAADGPGGKMRTLPSAAGPVDAGPTVLTLRSVFDAIFAAAGTRLDDHVTLIPQPVLARHWWPDGSTLDLHRDTEASAAAIRAFAGPRAEAEFRRFDTLADRLYRAFDAPVMRAPRPHLSGILRAALADPGLAPALVPGRSLDGVLRRSFTDPRLRQLFGRYATYVGGLPARTPAVLALIWQAEARGVWAVAGGMNRLAHALADLATARGAQVHYGTRATGLVQRSGRIVGVGLSDGRTLPATHVLFNGDPRALTAGALGPAAAAALPARTARALGRRSLSAEVWTFAARAHGPDLAHHNVFFTADPDTEFGPLARGLRPTAQSLYLCAEDRVGGPPPDDGSERFEIILNAPPRAPSDTTPQQDTASCHRRTFPTLARFGLTFSPTPQPTGSVLTGPAGFAALFPESLGALYGQSPHGPLAPFLRPGTRTRLPGLYLAGGGVHPGPGVPMAALSGRHAAAAIMTDLASTSPSPRTATPGGISTRSPTTVSAPSRSSAS